MEHSIYPNPHGVDWKKLLSTQDSKYNQANLNENTLQEIIAESILCSILSLSQGGQNL